MNTTSEQAISEHPMAAAIPLEPSGVAVLCTASGVGETLSDMAREVGYSLHSLDGFERQAYRQIAALAEDPAVNAIAVCLDASDADPALVAALDVARANGTRVVVLKAGLSNGKATALEFDIWRTMLARHGAVLALSHIELMDIALFLGTRDRPHLPHGKGVAILSGGGGNGVNAADLCARFGLEVPTLTPQTIEKLRPLVPAIASLGNPFDLTPEMGSAKYSGNYAEVLDLIADDPLVDTIFFPINAMSRARIAQIGVLADFRRRDRGDLMMTFNMLQPDAVAEFAHARAYNFVEPERGVRAFDRMIFCARVGEALAGLGKAAAASIDGWGIDIDPGVTGGFALRLNGVQHPTFGPVICIRPGGTFAGLLDDCVIAPAPFDATQAANLLSRTAMVKNIGKIDRKTNLDLAAEAISRFSHAFATSSYESIVIDTLIVTAERATAHEVSHG